MRKSYIDKVYSIPVYTGDVSGACSALYELGGMVVIHDPSGCNSTYNTHDETRWYDNPSQIYITGMNDIDAITGDDERLIEQVVSAANELKPRFIAYAASPLPYLNGTDFAGIAKLTESRTGIPCFWVPTNAMHDYSKGASEAFAAYARKFFPEGSGGNVKFCKDKVNIIGVTPLDFAGTVFKSGASIDGKEIVSCWAKDCTLEELARTPEAGVNIVASASGLETAKYLEEALGIPYRTGNRFYDVPRNKSNRFIIGDPVISGCIAGYLKDIKDEDYTVVATTEIAEELLQDGDIHEVREQYIRQILEDAETIIADPLYRAISPAGANFIELPHFALSGRLYRKRIPDLTKPEEYLYGT